MIKTVIFDMDGTLIDSNSMIESIYHELIRAYPLIISFNSLDLDQIRSQSYVQVIEQLYGYVDAIHLDYIKQIHKKQLNQLSLYPHVQMMLEKLKKQGMYLAIATSELKDIALCELEYLGILNYFNDIVCFEDVEESKPHPESLLRILSNSQAKSYEAIMIGDQLSDAIAAKKAHIMSVFMTWNTNDRISVSQHFDHVAQDIEQILEIIQKRQSLHLNFKDNHEFTICQFTDLHLMHNEKDQQTKKLIKKMNERIKPDFIVLTGDQIMHQNGAFLYQQLGEWMDDDKVPYGFVFGNHDTEGGVYETLVQAISPMTYVMFEQGPKHLGYSNYWIEVYHQEKIKWLIIFMDSHVDDMYDIDGKSVWGYGTIHKVQISWYERLVSRYPNIPSIIFMHIPPYEVRNFKKDDVLGVYEEHPSTPPIDSGFITCVQSLGHTKGIFFGHDHYNDFSYDDSGLLLAYGRVSGHYVYGREGFTPGARWIKFSLNGAIKTGIHINT